LDTVKNTITEYPVSGAEAPVLLSHLKLFAGKAFFTDQGATTNYLGEVDPSTNTVFEWLVPTANAATGDLIVQEAECNGKGGFLIEFSEFQGGKVASLNTAIQAPNSSVVVTPTVTPETPVVNTVVPVTRSLTPVVTKGAPVTTKVIGVVTGGFIEWAVPTLASGPGGVADLGPDILLFTERSGNKIGILLH
jgi:streptogramin lyase